MKKWIIKLVSLMLAIIMPMVAFTIVVENVSNQYDKTFFAEMLDKYELLKNTKEKKIVIVGGSSLPFGLRSDVIDDEFEDYKVVNYGLYAALGTKFMLDTSKVNIGKGDIVIIAPEISEQTYSTYFNAETVLQATDGYHEMHKYLSLDNNEQLLAKYMSYSYAKLEYARKKNKPDPVGIYRHDSFNEYGDIDVIRPSNIMLNGIDITTGINPRPELVSDDFISMINSYVRFVKRKGATPYFNYSPCSDVAITASRSLRDQFEEKIEKNIKCETLMSLDSCLLNYQYFYDTNFHLNTIGAYQFTNLLVAALKDKMGIEHGPVIDLDPPPLDSDEVPEIIPGEPTPFDEYQGEPNNDYLECFNYTLSGKSYMIDSVKDEYKDMENVILPAVYEGANIRMIASRAFEGCTNLKHIYVGNNYRVMEEESFYGCESLEGIHLFQMDSNMISVPFEGLLDGCNASVVIYIPSGSNYNVGYTWEAYSSYFVEV